ncbi:putative multi antimicrobial extrusion protein [Selenomonas ruminantium subsp. lactilytica TAM6421]|uniref:Putative multi antimicrobial extrusion protein n=1 Tax=Selenomonas ruminantium subsp. lactilytica (strain NBRC 103574 / TAM6421) TaxID=927704 RepID=I0GU44_SELRL|nr:MATE family efflux transporter [Selenomonas ruminantium]BAL84281.1 putative multi antimicrobial extrusion protein [Selenomonas ruminantium subsp. lactilytica TAM6421]
MTKNLTEGEPSRLILFFTLPLIAGNIFQQLYAFVDTLIVGRFLGVEALAAVGCTGSLMFLMLGFVIGFSTGITIYTGQRYGAKDFAGVRKSAATCAVLSLLEAAALTAFGVPMCRYLLLWMQTPPEIIDGAYSFISIVFGGIVMFVCLQTQTNLLRALGDSRMPTVILATALIINIILEPVAILVLGWGIPGAALATIVAQFLGNVVCYIYICKKVPVLRTHRADWQITRQDLQAHLRLGLPMGFQSSIIAIGAVILQVALNNLGPTAVAAYAAAQKVDSIALMPMMSFGLAMAAYTAQNYGAQKYDRIAEGVKKCSYMSVGFSILAGVLLILSGPYIMELFVGQGQDEVVSMGHEYLIVNGSTYWILSMLFIFRYTLQGLGQSVVPTIAGIMELLMRAGAAIFLCEIWGYFGACVANPMAWAGSCIPLAIAFFWTRRTFRKKYS